MKKWKTVFQLHSSLAGNSESSKIFCSINKLEEFNDSFSNIGKKLDPEFLTRSAVKVENQSQSLFPNSVSENDVKYAINNCEKKFALIAITLTIFSLKFF